MCKVSNKLKLCSCKTENVEKLKHYWILYRHNGEDNGIVGEAMLPANIGEASDKYNITTIIKLLNYENCFDIDMSLQQNDIFELHFTYYQDPDKDIILPCYGEFLAYAFVYKNNKWRKGDYDPFSENLDNVQSGKILRPFMKVKKNSN